MHGKAACSVKSDAARELVEAVQYLGWLPEELVPNDQHHNAKLESNIRRIKEATRASSPSSRVPARVLAKKYRVLLCCKEFHYPCPDTSK